MSLNNSDIRWTHQWKLNVVEASAGLGVDGSGKAFANISRELIQQGKEFGVKIVPFIPHLEQIAQGSGIANRKDIISTPDPSKPLPSDYIPGICMSNQATTELIGEWLAEIARIDGVTDIIAWLSEDRAPCFCEKCIGKEPFALEVKCIVKAFEKARLMRKRMFQNHGGNKICKIPSTGLSYQERKEILQC